MTDPWDREALFRADDYLYFYETRTSDDRSDADASTVWDLLGLRAGERVLDLACGHGRIANRLAARGAVVSGLDESASFLDLAREDASRRGVDVEYVQGDMRSLPWTSPTFDAALSWFTAFGYFDDDTNRSVLRAVRVALRDGGRFLMELNHRDVVLRTMQNWIVTERGDDRLIDRSTFDPLTSRFLTERTIVRDGRVRRTSYFVRTFTFPELRDWLLAAGFSSANGLGEDGAPLSLDHRRMLVVAHA